MTRRLVTEEAPALAADLGRDKNCQWGNSRESGEWGRGALCSLALWWSVGRVMMSLSGSIMKLS